MPLGGGPPSTAAVAGGEGEIRRKRETEIEWDQDPFWPAERAREGPWGGGEGGRECRKERERAGDSQTSRQTDRQTVRDGETETEREKDRETEKEGERERQRETVRQREKEIHRDSQRE